MMNDQLPPERPRPEDDPAQFIQREYSLTDEGMFVLFGTDAETQRRFLRGNPHVKSAVRDMEALRP